jgi:hypothetical protein
MEAGRDSDSMTWVDNKEAVSMGSSAYKVPVADKVRAHSPEPF